MFGDKAGNGRYFKLENEADLAVIGEEVVGNATFDSGRKRYVADPDGAFRFGVHVWDGSKLSLLEGGWRLYKALGEATNKSGEGCMLHVTRTGTGMNTQFAAEKARDLESEEIEAIRASERFDLGREFGWAKPTEEPGF